MTTVRMLPRKSLFGVLLLLAALFVLSSCATPTVQTTTRTQILHPDEEDNLGGSFLESHDIRTIATQMSGSLFSTPEIADNGDVVRIAMAPIRNSTRYLIDKDIFMKRLRMEMNRVAQGRVRFFAQKMNKKIRRRIQTELDEDSWDELISDVADYFANSSLVQDAKRPIKVAVIPVKKTNLVDLNAESFTAMIRSAIAEQAAGKIHFLARERNGMVIDQILAESDARGLGLVESIKDRPIAGVDYFLGGEFIARSLRPQKSSVEKTQTIGPDPEDPRKLKAQTTTEIVSPNASKYLNIMLIDAQTGVIPLEKMSRVERKVKSGLGRADYILTGEISALSKASGGGNRSDYVIMNFQLVEPSSNEVVWEDFYETKKVTNRSVLYK